MKKNIALVVMSLMIFTGLAHSQENESPKGDKDKPEIVINTSDNEAKDRIINAFAELVELSKDEIIEGGRLAKQQIPSVLQEVVALGRVKITVQYSLFFVLATVVCFLGKKLKAYCIAEDKKTDPEWSQSDLGVMFLASYFMQYAWPAITIIVMIINVNKLITPWVAPRVYIMEYVAQLIKSI